VDVIWLSPHYDSPNADNGYDIRDYRKVMTEFGTMADFDTMLAGIKKRHMRLIIDLVVNHTSDEHRWFVESSKSKDNPYRDYYIWRAGKDGGPPNNYPSFFSGSAWQLSPATNEYYLHYFAVKQPDLNWDNPKVRQEVYSLMKFWLDKGVDGFRMDVIPLISKPPGLPDIKPGTDFVHQWANGPHRDEYLQEMNHEVLSKYDVMTVGEAIGISLEESPKLVDERRNELNLIFNFDAIRINRGVGFRWKDWKLQDFKAIYAQHATELDTHSWDTVFLSNHDNPRTVSSFGNDSDEYRVPSAKLITTMLLTMRGTPFFYQGDELGMTNYPFQKIEDFDDIEVKNAYKAQVLTGKVTADEYFSNLRRTSRDNSRTPMQWDTTANAGFTTGTKPWLAVNPNYTKINAAEELKDPASPYSYMAKMVKLRKDAPALVYGDYRDLDPANASLFEYTRTLGAEKYLVVLNFSDKAAEFSVPAGTKLGQLVISNEGAAEGTTLKPWEARVYKF
jgi:oligo-1,6-glucosidase